MKFSQMLPAEAREGDAPAMIAAIDALLEAGVDARRPSNNPHQIKLAADLSFYPTTGAIVRDGAAGKLSARGLTAAIDLATGSLRF